MKKYNPSQIEKKWQEYWLTNSSFVAQENLDKEKKYILVEFPYPSGEGLHMGHLRAYTAGDVVARYYRMQGKEVMYPLGWDAFGLPAENYAIKHGIQPSVTTAQNISNMKAQCIALGYSFDWSREVNTTDPNYYKWTQWLFLQFFNAGLAYEATGVINWCPKDKTGLANEEVVSGACERCGTPVEQKELRQWYLKITEYADKLLQGLENLPEWPLAVKLQQANWIGKSEGAEIEFSVIPSHSPVIPSPSPVIPAKAGIQNSGSPGSDFVSPEDDTKVRVFTTRPDTIFGATYLVLAPEHQLVQTLKDQIQNFEEVLAYIEQTKAKAEMERTAEGKEKTGVELRGIKAINPATNEEIPVWIADYVLGGYGTGAIMAVPAHDERDFEFAKKFELPIKHVVMPSIIDETNPHREGKETKIRKTIHAIVYNPVKDEYLTLMWKKFPWHTVVLGGVDDGEDVVDAAAREVKEETGYKDLVFKRILGGPIEAKYFATHKDENRTAHTTGVYFELQSEARDEVSEEEKDSFDVEWVNRETFFSKPMTNSELPFWRQRLLEGDSAYIGLGTVINSGEFDGLSTAKAVKAMAEKFGTPKTTYKLRDWVFSRQRYWGEPIPLIHCEKDGVVAFPEDQLPVVLPEVKDYEPTGTGESPLAVIEEWVNTTCPTCGGPAKRETNTMPQWAGSSWYYLRYADSNNDQAFAGQDKLKYWLPIDIYFGGTEHTTLHLLYSRFWNIFFYDQGLVPVSEPYTKRVPHGIVLAADGTKMSKSKGNVVNPIEYVEKYGADTTRMYELFLGPHESSVVWSDQGISGVARFLDRVWYWVNNTTWAEESSQKAERELNILIKKITEDIETFAFNTAISSFMKFHNEIRDEAVNKDLALAFARLLSPFAPHLAEEIYSVLGGEGHLMTAQWPKYDDSKIAEEKMKIIIQVNGKVRDEILVATTATEQDIINEALSREKIASQLNGASPKKTVYVPGRLLSIVL